MIATCSSSFEHQMHAASLTEQLTADGWTVDADEVAALDADLEVTDPGELAALINPFRIRIITALARRPGSVKDLAARFDVPPTRLYHHLGLLEDVGALRVIGTRRSGARTERCYGAVRSGVGVSSELLAQHPDQVADSVVKMVGFAGEAFAAAVRGGRISLADSSSGDGILTWIAPKLTPGQRRDAAEELAAFAQRIADVSESNKEHDTPDAEPTIILLLGTPDVTVPD